MRTLSTRFRDPARPTEPSEEGDGYSPAFAAVALLFTLVLLAAPVVALWVLDAL
jgi:hypothetical protein